MFSLHIHSKTADVKYNNEMIPLLIFVRQLTWVYVVKSEDPSISPETHYTKNTEEPAIPIDVSDKHYTSGCNDETYRFMVFLLDNLKNNSYLQKLEYKECLDKMKILKSAYNSSSRRRYATRGKIVSYRFRPKVAESAILRVEYENGDMDEITFNEFVKKVLTDGTEEDEIEYSDKTLDLVKLVHDMEAYKTLNVTMDTFELEDPYIKMTMSNGDVRLNSVNIFMIIMRTDIYPKVFPVYYTESSLLERLKNGKYSIHQNITMTEEPFKFPVNGLTYDIMAPMRGYRFSSIKQREMMEQEKLYSLYQEHIENVHKKKNDYFIPNGVMTNTDKLYKQIFRTEMDEICKGHTNFIIYTEEEINKQSNPAEYMYEKYKNSK
jgi:hypothetical protein